MSSLTKFLHVNRQRRHVSGKGGLKTPMLMQYPVPESFETASISLRTGEFHVVGVKAKQPTRTGFFEASILDEEEVFADLIRHLYNQGELKATGNVAEVNGISEEAIQDIQAFFTTYDLGSEHIFVSLVGFAALVTSELITLPVEVNDTSQITEEDLKEWATEYFHVGRVKGIPVFYSPNLGPHIVFSADPKEVGVLARVGDYISIMVHNAERSVVILRLGFLNPSIVGGESNKGRKHDDTRHDNEGGTEAYSGSDSSEVS